MQSEELAWEINISELFSFFETTLRERSKYRIRTLKQIKQTDRNVTISRSVVNF